MKTLIQRIWRFSSIFKVTTVVLMVCLLLAYLAPFIDPGVVKLLPFFGLAYPVFISLALFFLIGWTIARSKWAIYLAVVILVGGKLHFRTLAIRFSDDTEPTSGIPWKVMSYNVRLFDVYNPSLEGRNTTKDSIMDYIRSENPDIICFQEFYHQDGNESFKTRDFLTKTLGYSNYHERYSHRIRNRQNFGICMVSKYPMIAKGDVMFKNFNNTDNYCIYADIVKNNDTIRVYDIHLQSIKLQQEDYELFGEKNKQSGSKKSTVSLLIDKLRIAYPARAEQARRVVEHMETSPYPVVVCGDFNDTPMSYVYNQFSTRLIDSFRESNSGIGVTYAGRVPAGRIDYVFHSEDIEAHNFKIQQKAFSDHLAVQCTIWTSVK